MKKTKTQKGITLVALIITIIILLILAVVTISAVSGDGIIQHAKNASNSYNSAKEDENGVLLGYESYLNNNVSKDEDDAEINFYKLFVENNDYASNPKEYGIAFTNENKFYALRLDYGQIRTDESSVRYIFSCKYRRIR